MSWYGGWRPYVPVAQRRARAAAYAAKLARKENRTLAPVQITGRKLAHSFWGQAWCQNLEQYSDFANRLPRGRTYTRNGSIIDLQIKAGKVEAIVSGSEIYHVTIDIQTLSSRIWKRIKQDCAQSIDSLIDLLQGRFSEGVMGRLTQPQDGLFPRPGEIAIECSCPDWARLCKHAAAVLYGVGARLDTAPEMLFVLRKVDHLELVNQAVDAENLDRSLSAGSGSTLAAGDLGEIFGIELDVGNSPSGKESARTRQPGSTQPQASATVSEPATQAGRKTGTEAGGKSTSRRKSEEPPPAGRSIKGKLASPTPPAGKERSRKLARRRARETSTLPS